METSDRNSCWHQQSVIEEMNRFFDQHSKDLEVMSHLLAFTHLLSRTDLAGQHKTIIDLGCGTALLSEFCPGFEYYGSDLPHVLAGCAMRNYPKLMYRACDIESDDLGWTAAHDITVINGVLDIMQHPMEFLKRLLTSTSEYVIIHRQEITEKGATTSVQNPSYGGYTWHSIINGDEFVSCLDAHHYDIVGQAKLGFTNWENGGRSFLLRRRKSWALHDIDKKLYQKYFLGKTEGRFLEAGANNGLRQSNTMYFEFYKNWTGTLIEPIAEQFRQCYHANRSPRNFFANVALVGVHAPENTQVDIFYTPENNGLMSTTNSERAPELLKRINDEAVENRTVPGVPLTRFIKPSQVIDLLVLDIEGYEATVLKDIDFGLYRIEHMLIEELDCDDTIVKMLAPWYHQVEQFGEHDFLYKRYIRREF
jgi:FkbM family methyltransferase